KSELAGGQDQVGVDDDAQDVIGREAQIKGGEHRDDDHHGGGGTKAGGRVGRDVAFVFAHVHHDDDTQVVVGADDAVDGHQNGQPNELGLDGRGEDVQLAEEARGDGQAEQGKQEHAQSSSNKGLARAEAREIIDVDVAFTLPAQIGNDREG